MFLISLIGILPVLCHGVAYGYEYDYPPVANAGPDIVLHLPQNWVTLNGSLSTDDHSSLQYQWTKVTNDLSADMQGTRTPLLKLSNLQLGDYTFKLTVTDSSGQYRSSQVRVFVKTALCESRDIHTLLAEQGEFNSQNYPSPSCVEWFITGPPSSNITIRFTGLRLDNFDSGSFNCGKHAHIELGPLPEKMICGSLDELGSDQVYISKRNHMWIKFVRNKDLLNNGAYFALRYIASSPFRTCQTDDFRCDDGRCIFSDWKCNGMSECGDWSDEQDCGVQAEGLKTTTSPQTPRPLYKYKDNTNNQLGNCDTVYCYVAAYGMDMCIASWDMCDGREQCFNGEDEKPEKCAGKTTKKATTPRPAYWTQRPKKTTTELSRCNTVYCFVSTLGYVCLDKMDLCNGIRECDNGMDENKETCDAYTDRGLSNTNSGLSNCGYDEVFCQYEGNNICLPRQYKCDGQKECDGGEDEDPVLCAGEDSCNRRLEAHTGWFSTPHYPHHYPNNKQCSWEIHSLGEQDTQIQLHFVTFMLQRDSNTDYVEIYDGADDSYPLLGRYDGSSNIPEKITSSRGWMFVKFVSDGYISYNGFNATYQMKGYCLPDQLSCGFGQECYDKSQNCDGHWDCINGGDENQCHNCQNGYFTCGPGTLQCYERSERCNGYLKCSNNADEEFCDAEQCGPHNGTFLCGNLRCIYEEWTCDQRDDCGDYSDELHCFRSSKRVIIAAISGSVICALLLTILIGCSCKLYSLRTIERHGGIRHHSPMSRLYAEFLRRTAPPPYHEAMLTSRNYDEVQQERRERLLSQRRARRSSRQENNAENSATADNNESAENPTDGANTGERDNLTFVNEVEVSENNSNPSVVQDTAGNSGVTINRSTEATEDQNTDSDSDSDSSDDHEENVVDRDNVISQDSIEMQATGLSSRVGDVVEQDESSDDSCILNHISYGEETSQNLDNESISLDDISMETASASINLELTEISEETNVDNTENGEPEDLDKGTNCEVENMENMRRSAEPKEEGSNVIGVGPSRRRNSQESLNSLHSNCSADSDEPLLVA